MASNSACRGSIRACLYASHRGHGRQRKKYPHRTRDLSSDVRLSVLVELYSCSSSRRSSSEYTAIITITSTDGASSNTTPSLTHHDRALAVAPYVFPPARASWLRRLCVQAASPSRWSSEKINNSTPTRPVLCSVETLRQTKINTVLVRFPSYVRHSRDYSRWALCRKLARVNNGIEK